MAETVSIEVVDKMATKAGVSILKLEQKLEKLERRLKRIGKLSAMPEIGADVSGFYRKMHGVEKRLDKLDGRRASVRLDAWDNASGAIGAVAGLAAGLAGRTYRLNIGITDNVTGPLQKIIAEANVSLGLLGLGGGRTYSGSGGGIVIMNSNTTNTSSSGGGGSGSSTDLMATFLGMVGTLNKVPLLSGKVADIFSKGKDYGIKDWEKNKGTYAMMAVQGGINAIGTMGSAVGDFMNAAESVGVERSYNTTKGVTKSAGTIAGGVIGQILIPIPGVGAAIGAGIGSELGTAISGPLAELFTGFNEEENQVRLAELEPAIEGYTEATKKAIRQSRLTVAELNNIKKTRMDEWYKGVSLSMQEVADLGEVVFRSGMGSDGLGKMVAFEDSVQQSGQFLQQTQISYQRLNSSKYELPEGGSLSQEASEDYATNAMDYANSLVAYLSEMQLQWEFNSLYDEDSEYGKAAANKWGELEGEASTLTEELFQALSGALSEEGKSPYRIDDDEMNEIKGILSGLNEIDEEVFNARQQAQLDNLNGALEDPKTLDMTSLMAAIEMIDSVGKENTELRREQYEGNFITNALLGEDGKSRGEVEADLQNQLQEDGQGIADILAPFLDELTQRTMSMFGDENNLLAEAMTGSLDLEGFLLRYYAAGGENANPAQIQSMFIDSMNLESFGALLKTQSEDGVEMAQILKNVYETTGGGEVPPEVEKLLTDLEQWGDQDAKELYEGIDVNELDKRKLFDDAYKRLDDADIEQGDLGEEFLREVILNKNQKIPTDFFFTALDILKQAGDPDGGADTSTDILPGMPIISSFFSQLFPKESTEDFEPSDETTSAVTDFANEAVIQALGAGAAVVKDMDLEQPSLEELMASNGDMEFPTIGELLMGMIGEGGMEMPSFAELFGMEDPAGLAPEGLIGPALVDTLLSEDLSAVPEAVGQIKETSDQMLKAPFQQPVDIEQKVNIKYTVTHIGRPTGLGGGTTNLEWNPYQPAFTATGGIIGSTTLSWLAEEGWPEAVIPFDPKRRHRALGLWQETGKRLGVLENAAGGIVGDYGRVSIPEFSGSGGGSEGGGSAITIGDGAVQISVKAQDGQSVTEVLSENLENIGMQVAQVIVQKLEPQFENTPMRAG